MSLTKQTVMRESGWALGNRCWTLQVSKDFIIFKINVKVTENLSSVLLLNLKLLHHQIFNTFVRKIKLEVPFCRILTQKIRGVDAPQAQVSDHCNQQLLWLSYSDVFLLQSLQTMILKTKPLFLHSNQNS